MGMVSVADLKRQWQHATITNEQMIGQMVQHIEAVYEKQRELEREYIHLTKKVAALDARMDSTPGKKTTRMQSGRIKR